MKTILISLLFLLTCTPVHSAGKYTVQGKVSLSSGAPAPGLTVQVFCGSGKSSALQESSKTAPNGTYKIIYHPQAKLKGVTLVIRVLDKKGRLLYRSPYIKRARPIVTFNVNLP